MSFQGQVSHSVAVAERFLTFYSYILAGPTPTAKPRAYRHTSGNFYEEVY